MSEDHLSDAERAAMEEDDDTGNPPADDDLDDDLDDDPEGGPPPADDPPAKEPAADDPPKDEGKDASSDKTEADKTADKEASLARLDEIKAEIEALDQQFDDADLSTKEYREKIASLTDERAKIDASILREEIKQDVQKEENAKAWGKAQDAFFAKEENKRFLDDENLLVALDSQVKKVARDTKNKSMGLDEILATARKNVAKSFGLADAKPVDNKDDRVAKPERPRRPDVPVDIGGLPPASTEKPADGRFSHLDRLKGDALEDAVARMSDAEKEAWARA